LDNGMRNTTLIAAVLLGWGTLANMYMDENASRDRNRVVAGPGSYGVNRPLVETPVSSSLPARFLNREAVSISREPNASVLKSVFAVFDPLLRSFLTSVPIVLDASADTAKAYPAKGTIGVSPDWDNTVHQSKYRVIYEQRGMKPEDPVFIHRFKTDLLIHEFLHILQVHQRIDGPLCYEAVARWYVDPRYGRPSPNGMVHADTANDGRLDVLAINRMKYIVWHELYNKGRLSDVPPHESWKDMEYSKRYRSAKKGVEEFAYIGQEILSSGSGSENYVRTGQWCDEDWKSKKMRLLEVSPEVVAVFRGVFNPALTQ
jgi:hypothetical protein